ncbi:MAG: glycine dehydrogenase, partial [Candidatus Sericytochromatia bacterium]
MRYLPLTQTDRAAMLSVVGANTIDDLFVDVPEAARLDGPVHGLPNHATELVVERHMTKLARQN